MQALSSAAGLQVVRQREELQQGLLQLVVSGSGGLALEKRQETLLLTEPETMTVFDQRALLDINAKSTESYKYKYMNFKL